MRSWKAARRGGMPAASAWSRGQAWAIYGFTAAYRLSGEGTGKPEITRKAYDDLTRLSQQDIQALVKEIYSTPPEIAQKAASFLR